MNRDLWIENVIDILRDISDRNIQMKAWFKGEGDCPIPDEMYCMLFDDYSIELFIEDKFIALNNEQKSSAKKLVVIMNTYSEGCGDSMTPSDTINDDSWDDIRVQAKDFLVKLTKSK